MKKTKIFKVPYLKVGDRVWEDSQVAKVDLGYLGSIEEITPLLVKEGGFITPALFCWWVIETPSELGLEEEEVKKEVENLKSKDLYPPYYEGRRALPVIVELDEEGEPGMWIEWGEEALNLLEKASYIEEVELEEDRAGGFKIRSLKESFEKMEVSG